MRSPPMSKHCKLIVQAFCSSKDFVRYQRLVFRHKLYQLREERDMKPETFASLVSAIIYEKRSVRVLSSYLACFFVKFIYFFSLSLNHDLER